jgi:hypothetical protein
MKRKRFSVVPNLSVLKSRFRSHALPFASSLVSSPNLICSQVPDQLANLMVIGTSTAAVPFSPKVPSQCRFPEALT